MLSVSSFYKRKKQGLALMPIPLCMAFQPTAFLRCGYPVSVNSWKEILRYADHNSEAEVPLFFEKNSTFKPIGYFNRFTQDEAEMIQKLRDRLSVGILKNFGRNLKPITNLLVQTGPFRVFWHLKMTYLLTPLKVFEYGPGAGYLGALFSQLDEKFKYHSFDVTESLYLWQNFLFETMAGAAFLELAENPETISFEHHRNIHWPWWKFVKCLDGEVPQVDVVYSNSNLGEMTHAALRVVLNLAFRMLSNSELGLFAFFTEGSPVESSVEQVHQQLVAAGFEKILSEPFQAYLPKGKNKNKLAQAFKNGIPFYDPSGRGGILEANQVVSILPQEAPLDLGYAAWRYEWKPPFASQ